MEYDTIVALATPLGEGGVGVVRASGPLSALLAERLFPSVPPPWPPRRMRQGTVIDPETDHPLDRAVGCLMESPRSYTGEDVFEIHCHGSPLVLEQVVRACLRLGCRSARPGEFTLRAFLNGRMDLSQAEAVLDVVRARTNAGLELAMQQLTGWLSQRSEPVRQDLLGALAHVEAMVDFVEDDIPPALDASTLCRLNVSRETIDTLLDGAEQGIVLREGATLAIVGSPNVGKSSIMNGLLGMDRSIVTPVAGTTRDTVEETLEVRGVPFRAIDTAGITDTTDIVEQVGIERSRQTLHAADVVLLVLDRSRQFSLQDRLAMNIVAAAGEQRTADGRGHRLVVALNKADLPGALQVDGELDGLSPVAIVDSSTEVANGLDAVRGALEHAAVGKRRHEFLVGNVRHQDALRRASTALREAGQSLHAGTPLDLVSLDVRAAVAALGEISGAQMDAELLDRIFQDFCIGK